MSAVEGVAEPSILELDTLRSVGYAAQPSLCKLRRVANVATGGPGGRRERARRLAGRRRCGTIWDSAIDEGERGMGMRTFRGFALLPLALFAFGAEAAPSGAEELPTEAKCEFIASPGSSECMLPFPDDYYTKADLTSPTGRRIDFRELAMPKNASGVPIEAAPYNTGDGFSPGSVITLKIPGIETVADVTATRAVAINYLGRYKAVNAPIVVIDASTGQRWPIWVEIDSTVKAEKANVEIHPAVNFISGHRYVVALRNLVNAKKEHLQAPEGFRFYRDNLPSSEEKVNARRPHFGELFTKLEAAATQRSS